MTGTSLDPAVPQSASYDRFETTLGHSVPGGASRASSPGASWLSRQAYQMARDLGYLAPGFPIAVASFTVLATGVAAAVGLAVVWIGLPILVVTLMTARGFGRLELRRVAARSGRREPTKRQRQTPSLRELGDSRGWFALLHGVAILPVRMITWTVPLVWIVAAGVGGTCPLWFWLVPRGQITLLHLFGVESRPLDFAVTTVIGWVFTVTAPFVVRAAAAAETGMARVLLASAGADHER